MREKSCGAIIYRVNKGEIEYLLVQQKSYNWGFPKGHVEKKETEEETALREIKEETGLDVKLHPRFRQTGYYYTRGSRKKVVFFLARAKKQQTLKLGEDEILDAVWADFNTAKRLLRFPNTQDMLENAHYFILKDA